VIPGGNVLGPGAVVAHEPSAADAGQGTSTPEGRGWLGRLWSAAVAVIGAVLGLVPHLLHHIGFLVGAAAVTGAAGSALFGALGLLFSVPFLLRLRRRFGTWRAPALALVLFAVMFSLSAFVIGPAISGGDDPAVPTPIPTPTPTEVHDIHHT
jgi:hypothetical protein